MDTKLLNNSIEYDTLELLAEEDEGMAKFHNENIIYLYCTLERASASNIINTNIYKTPITLYETPSISRAMAINIQDPVTLRIAVNLELNNKEYCYDQFTMQDAIIKSKYKVKNIEEYKSKCVYTRCLATEPKSKSKVIQYTVLHQSKLLSNPQYL